MPQEIRQTELRKKAQQLLEGPLKHIRGAALAAALVPLASLAATPAAAQTPTPCASGGVCGVVFNDANNNGLLESGETGIPGITLTVCQLCDGTDNMPVTTNDDGFYSLFVPGGTTTITVPIPPGTQPSPLGSSVATVQASGLPTNFGFAAATYALNVTITATCACEYTVSASGHADANAVVGIDISFNVIQNGVTYFVSKHIDTNADANGNFSVTIPGNPLPGGCVGVVEFSGFSGGEASFTFNGTTRIGIPANLPSTLFCNTPPPGKTFDIGPSSMEGHLLIRQADWISGGYSFKFANGSHPASTVKISSTLTLPFKCSDGTSGQFVINLGTQSVSVPANNTDWQPTGDANSVLSWAGSGQAPAGCGPGKVMDNSKGAVFEATVRLNPDNGSLLNWRFKYRDPNAKGKGNVNCIDTTDPRRSKADVCGASWSQTVKDP
jgi:hypothetical protein